MKYLVKLTPAAAEMYKSIHPEVRKQIKAILQELQVNPYFGKPLHNKLAEFRSFKMKRYRIVYRTDETNESTIVYGIGHRKDIYEMATELVRQS